MTIYIVKMLLPRLLFLLLTTKCQLVKQPCILAPLPFSGNHPATCELAMEFTNNTLKIIPADNAAEFSTIMDFVSRVFSRNDGNDSTKDCSEVIGVVGDLDLTTASIIHTLASKANLSITLVSAVAPSTFLPTTNLNLPNLIHMNPLTHYVEALAAFLDHLNWTRVGLISDSTHYYEFAAELIQQKLLENQERQIIPFVRISEKDNKTETIQTFKEYETDIIVISTNDYVACSLIQEAKRAGFVWPEYAWIVFEVSFHPSFETCQEEGLILFKNQNDLLKSSYHVQCSKKETVKFLNSTIFLNSISVVTSVQETIPLNDGGKCREGSLLNNITVFQIDSSRARKEVAFYNAESWLLKVLGSFSVVDGKPRGRTLKKYYNDFNFTLRITLVSLACLTLLVFVTAVFILFIYFRKEPEIKATSVTVSMSMFLACFVLISFFPLLVIEQRTVAHCQILAWLGLSGFPFPLIIATLFVKMLRVYFIFSNPHVYKKMYFYDPSLFLYILLLVSPSLLILVIWSSYDPFSPAEQIQSHQDHIFVYTGCLSDYTIHWLSAQFTYFFILTFSMTCLAFKTSKIRYKHFRDTKATNAFAFLSILVIILTLIYWYFFRKQQELSAITLNVASGVLYTGSSCIVLLCQVLLFLPKVYPPLKRRLDQSQVKCT